MRTLLLLALLVGLAGVDQGQSKPKSAKQHTTIAATDTVVTRALVAEKIQKAIQWRQGEIQRMQVEIIKLEGMWQGVQMAKDSLITVAKDVLDR